MMNRPLRAPSPPPRPPAAQPQNPVAKPLYRWLLEVAAQLIGATFVIGLVAGFLRLEWGVVACVWQHVGAWMP